MTDADEPAELEPNRDWLDDEPFRETFGDKVLFLGLALAIFVVSAGLAIAVVIAVANGT